MWNQVTHIFHFLIKWLQCWVVNHNLKHQFKWVNYIHFLISMWSLPFQGFLACTWAGRTPELLRWPKLRLRGGTIQARWGCRAAPDPSYTVREKHPSLTGPPLTAPFFSPSWTLSNIPLIFWLIQFSDCEMENEREWETLITSPEFYYVKASIAKNVRNKMLVNRHIKQMYENHYCVLLLTARWGEDVGKLVRAHQRLSWMDIKSLWKTQFVAPLICGQMLFLQVSTHTSTAKADASRHSRCSDVRAKNLHREVKASQHKELLILHQKTEQSPTIQQGSFHERLKNETKHFLLPCTRLHSFVWRERWLPIDANRKVCARQLCHLFPNYMDSELFKLSDAAQHSDHNTWNFAFHSSVAASFQLEINPRKNLFTGWVYVVRAGAAWIYHVTLSSHLECHTMERGGHHYPSICDNSLCCWFMHKHQMNAPIGAETIPHHCVRVYWPDEQPCIPVSNKIRRLQSTSGKQHKLLCLTFTNAAV